MTFPQALALIHIEGASAEYMNLQSCLISLQTFLKNVELSINSDIAWYSRYNVARYLIVDSALRWEIRVLHKILALCCGWKSNQELIRQTANWWRTFSFKLLPLSPAWLQHKTKPRSECFTRQWMEEQQWRMFGCRTAGVSQGNCQLYKSFRWK